MGGARKKEKPVGQKGKNIREHGKIRQRLRELAKIQEGEGFKVRMRQDRMKIGKKGWSLNEEKEDLKDNKKI